MENIELNSSTQDPSLDPLIQPYGDLIFDLCQGVIHSSVHSQVAFRSIVKKLLNRNKKEKFSTYHRSWVLQIACTKIMDFYRQYRADLVLAEALPSELQEDRSIKPDQFLYHFRRLSPEDQLLLLLKDKHGIPLAEIAIALKTAEDSLKIRRQQALRSLEEWLWPHL